jgi:8-oxo-dGTP pyrophosphatase MutT (NUDIX family)
VTKRSPSTKPRRLSAGVVVVRETPAGLRWLALRAYRNWDFPKGIVGADEEPLAAARRETAEETGIEELDFPWGFDYTETEPYASNKVARYYLGRASTDRVVLRPNPELGRPEHHEYRWVGADEARLLLSPRLLRVLEWSIRHLAARSEKA